MADKRMFSASFLTLTIHNTQVDYRIRMWVSGKTSVPRWPNIGRAFGLG